LGKNKKWGGYTSWGYLEPGVDYYSFKLEPQVDRVPPYDFGLTADQVDRV